MNRRSKLAITLFIAVAAVTAAGLGMRSKKEAIPAQTVTVNKNEITRTVNIRGNIEPNRRRNLKFHTEGTIALLNIKPGDRVKKGDLLARLSDIEARTNLLRKEQEIETAKLKSSTRKVALLTLEAQGLREKVMQCEIRAPFSGTIMAVNREQGEYYAESAASAKEPVIVIADNSRLKARVTVDEIDFPAINLGQTAALKFEALPNQTFTGRVTRLPLLGELNSKNLAAMKITITLDESDDRIVVPYSFSGTIAVSTPQQILSLPASAIDYKEDKTFATRLGPDGTTETVEVKLKSLSPGILEVVSGLNYGDTLVMPKEQVQTGLMEMGA